MVKNNWLFLFAITWCSPCRTTAAAQTKPHTNITHTIVGTTNGNNNSTMPTDSSRRLRNNLVYGNLNCPLEMSSMSNFHRRANSLANKARSYSESHKAPGRVAREFKTGKMRNRKIIFLGDSLTRHLFIALGCLSRMISKSYVAWEPWPAIHPKDIAVGEHSGYKTGRTILSSGTELLYYHLPRSINDKVPHPLPTVDQSRGPYSWINSCQKRAPFQIKRPSTVGGGVMTLTKNDVVILNGSVWPVRNELIAGYERLLKCMDDAGRSVRRNWPTIYYMVTPMSHPFLNGACQNTDTLSDRIVTDIDTFSQYASVSSLLGYDLPWPSFASYHVGYGDCVHYTQMGVHDVIAADLAEKIGTVTTKHPTTPPTPAPTTYCQRYDYSTSTQCTNDLKCRWNPNTWSCLDLTCDNFQKSTSCDMHPECTWNPELNECKTLHCASMKRSTSCSNHPKCFWAPRVNECRATNCHAKKSRDCEKALKCQWSNNLNQCITLNCQKHQFPGQCMKDKDCVWNKKCVIKIPTPMPTPMPTPNCQRYKRSDPCDNHSGCHWSNQRNECDVIKCRDFNDYANCTQKLNCKWNGTDKKCEMSK